ncbi:hypothetical protein Taro_008883 [Colocasia esculenta]|uniref:Uncharacterized protein n=1 Tax=Colocasia esculenta TaxID=4460 RepID=A0A843U492_COLES|nr:hypothetical protein [Colocasia esculenta]
MEHSTGLPLCWCRDHGVRRDTRRGLCPVGRDLIVTRLLSRCPSPSRWYRDGLGGRNSACVCLRCSVVPFGVLVCAPGLAFPQDLQVGNAEALPTSLLRVRACLALAGLVVVYKLAFRRGSYCACSACSPGALHLRACPVQRLSPLPGTPILESLLKECSELRACSSWQPSWQTLERREKRGLDSGAESFVELSCLGWDAEVVEAVLFLARPKQSFVSLPLSALVPEPRSGARRGVAAWPGCGVACICVFLWRLCLALPRRGGRSQAGEQRAWTTCPPLGF